MDHEAFEDDVHSDMGNGTFTDQSSELATGGTCITIGETWQGALYGHEENTYGQRATHRFETEDEQRAWFDAVTAEHTRRACPGCGLECDPEESTWCPECGRRVADR